MPDVATQTLRAYQSTANSDVLRHLRAGRKPILVIPTGGGKTFSAAKLVHDLGLPTLWMAHRRELVTQAAATLRSLGLQVGVILAGHAWYQNRQVQVASVQTLARRAMPAAQLVVWDEVHHCASKTWGRVFREYPDAMHLGLTATPWRLDSRPLGEWFDEIVVGAWAEDLIRDGVLIEPRVYAPPPASLAGVTKRGGDYETSSLARVVDKPKLVGDIVDTWKKHAAGRRTIVFAVNIAHSQHIIEQFVAAGVAAEHIDGGMTRERDAVLKRLASGETLVVSNCQCVTEGWDLPALECAILARPTQSLCLHVQTTGRVMRSCAGKTSAIVLDHSGNFLRHGRVTRRFVYSLDGRTTAAAEPTGLRTCPRCYRMCAAGRTACPECGFDFTTAPRELPESVDGVLVEYEDPEVAAEKARADERDAAWWKLVHTARARRFKPGWVAYEFHRRYGEWRDVRPIAHIVAAPDREPATVEEMLDFAGGVR